MSLPWENKTFYKKNVVINHRFTKLKRLPILREFARQTKYIRTFVLERNVLSFPVCSFDNHLHHKSFFSVTRDIKSNRATKKFASALNFQGRIGKF